MSAEPGRPPRRRRSAQGNLIIAESASAASREEQLTRVPKGCNSYPPPRGLAV